MMNDKTEQLLLAMEQIDTAYLEEALDFQPEVRGAKGSENGREKSNARRTIRFPKLSAACAALLIVFGLSATAFAVSRFITLEDEAAPVTIAANVPLENIRAEYTYGDPVPSATADAVYLSTNTVSVLDLDSGEITALSTPEENIHSTWSGGSSLFGEYNSNCYTTYRTDSGDIIVECTSYDEQTRKNIGTLSGVNESILDPSYMCFSYGYAYIMTGERGSLYRMDLNTGAATDLLRCNKDEQFDFLGASEEHVAILYTNYHDGNREELRLYDFACLNYQVLCGSEDGFISSVDPHVCYGDTLVYQNDTKFMLCDLTSGQVTELCQQENVVNYWLIDGKLFTVVTAEDGCTQFYTNLNDGVAKELKAQRGTVSIRFSAHQETGEYFIGNLSGENGLYYIKKADFYAGQFDAAVAMGLF